MIKDAFLSEYLKRLVEEKQRLQAGMAQVTFESLYDVGRMQGQVAGVDRSIQLLEALYEEQDQ